MQPMATSSRLPSSTQFPDCSQQGEAALMQVWNTEGLPYREQFGYWREVLCEAFVTLRPERPREPNSGRFPSRVTARPLSTINVTTVQSRAHHVIRGDAEIRKSPREVYFL